MQKQIRNEALASRLVMSHETEPGTWILLQIVSLDFESRGGSAGGPADEKEAMATWLGEAAQHVSIFTLSFRQPERRWALEWPEKSL